MGTRPGYEYRYGFRLHGGAIPEQIVNDQRLSGMKVFYFKNRTNFRLRRRLGDEDLIGSEIFDVSVGEDNEDGSSERYMKLWMGHRLQAYWIIPNEEIEFMVSRAFDFAKQRATADDGDNDAQLIIPVVVDLDVCTVQLETETIDEAFDRAIRAECLVPLYLYPNHSGRNDEIRHHIDRMLQTFLRTDLAKIRVEEDADRGLTLMDTCPICLRNPTVGSQVSLLPSCGHAFHSHCIVRWFVKSNLCPLSRFPAHDFPVCKKLPCRLCQGA